MTNLENIPTEELMKELNKRKKCEVPNLIRTINESLESLKTYGYIIRNSNGDDYKLVKIIYDPDRDETTYYDKYYEE